MLLLLLLFVIECKEDKQVIKSEELGLVAEYKPQEKIPSSYAFEWRITYEMEANDNKLDCHYMVKPKASYYGVVMVISKKDFSKNSITIVDFGRQKRLTLLNRKDGKFLRVKNMPKLKDSVVQPITMERIDTKDVLGYTCQGYKISTNEGTSTLYITQDAGFGFNKDLGQYSKKRLKGKGIDESILNELENGLVMEMEYVGNENSTQATSSKMKIKEFSKARISVDLSKHKTIGI